MGRGDADFCRRGVRRLRQHGAPEPQQGGLGLGLNSPAKK
jgi:hypothetical protein